MDATVNSAERAVLDWLAQRQVAMIELIEALVNIDSSSADKSGVDAVGERIMRFLGDHGIRCDVIPSQRYGNALRAGIGGGEGQPIVLMGHRDTVFPRGEAERRRFRVADGRGHGPGCADMKSGLAMNAFVLAALQVCSGAAAPVVGLFTGDEEIGSPFSRSVIESEARNARAVFNAEPGRSGGKVVIGRKGGLFMRLDVTGKAAHAGANFADGISAIEEIAHKIIALHALADPAKGITLNVGTVAGGQTVNTVAPSARAEFDLRFVRHADRDTAMAAIRRIVATHHLAGATATLEFIAEFLPLVQNAGSKHLFQHYVACAQTLGLEVEGIHTGGCADSGFAASVGAPTLCATGPIGGRAHTPEEYVEIASLVPRAQTLALAIMRLDQG